MDVKESEGECEKCGMYGLLGDGLCVRCWDRDCKRRRVKVGSTVKRTIELKPARKVAERLFREGNSPVEVQRMLKQDFGLIADTTLFGWKKRMALPKDTIMEKAVELVSARQRFEELRKEGKKIPEVRKLLIPQYGDISPRTLYSWDRRRVREVATESPTERGHPLPDVLELVFSKFPNSDPRERYIAWKKLFDAAFEFFMSGSR